MLVVSSGRQKKPCLLSICVSHCSHVQTPDLFCVVCVRLSSALAEILKLKLLR